MDPMGRGTKNDALGFEENFPSAENSRGAEPHTKVTGPPPVGVLGRTLDPTGEWKGLQKHGMAEKSIWCVAWKKRTTE